MSQIIYSVTEAFSMQPNAFYVGAKLEGGTIAKFEFFSQVDANDTVRALDKDGNLLGEYRRLAININYK